MWTSDSYSCIDGRPYNLNFISTVKSMQSGITTLAQFVIAALFFTTVPAVAQQGESVLSGANYYAARQDAIAMYEDGRYSEAARVLAQLAPRSPNDSSVWFILARARDRLYQKRSAIDAYRTAYDIGYRYGGWIPYRVAQLYSELSRDNPSATDSAFVWLERALITGYGDRPGITHADAFSGIRDDPRFAAATGRPTEEMSRDEGWRFDIDYFVKEAQRMHSGLDRPAYAPAFESAAKALKAAVPELSNDQIVAELGRLAVMLGDGHTGIYGPDPDSPLEFESGSLPVVFYAFNEGLHIVDAAPDFERLIGSRVMAFGPRTAGEVLSDLPTYIHHDNAMTPLWLGIHFSLRRLSILRALGVSNDLSRVTLTLRGRDGIEHQITLEGSDHEFRRKLRSPHEQDSPPRWLRHVDRNYWFDRLPQADAIYWQFNQVRNMDDGPSIARFADTLRVALETTEVRTLIVDVRHNNGGNNGLLDPLLRALVWWEQDASGRRIFVITGRNTFSAAQNFITRLERLTDAIFVGEPSSSRPNFSGEETNLLLPYSKVRGSISNRYWQDSNPDDMRPWIPPTVPVTLSSKDYFSGHDPAMAAIFDILSSESGR